MINLSPKTKRILKKVLISFGVLILVGIVLWILVVSPYLTRQEKQRFESAAVELEKVSKDIQEKVGQASSVEADNSCDRPNLKFEKGPLSCNVSVGLIYLVPSFVEANQIIDKLKSTNSSPVREGPFAKGTRFISLNEEKKQILYQAIDSISGFSCALSYRLEGNTDNTALLVVTAGCGGPARAEHYPVEE